ncbi:MAG: polymer-forming cytoskeletal protein [Euryarchaeota archaeon]|nr:polymer-forming cytoskeletal protein [Euryarchaeota archaeon]
MVFDKKTLVIPDDTKFEEHTILTVGDVILGNHTEMEYGVITSGRFFGGESVRVNGNLKADGEVRLDMFGRVDGSVTCKGDVYLGEKCRIDGTLQLEGDLDVGDDVQIKDGFEAKGWINIRNPIPVVVYLFIYMMELLRLGRSEEVERILKELEAEGEEEILIGDVFLYVPDGSRLGLTQSDVKGNLRIGAGCRVLGNFTVKGDVFVGKETKLYGAIRATGGLKIMEGAEVQGEIQVEGPVDIGPGCHVLGDLTGDSVVMHQSAIVDGTLNAPYGIRFVTDKDKKMDEKVERFQADQLDDIVDLLR